MMPDNFSDDLFSKVNGDVRQSIGAQAYILRGYALPYVNSILTVLSTILIQAPLRHMMTPNGQKMSVAMSNCGSLGWTSSKKGYCYTQQDPETGQDWPLLPKVFLKLAYNAAKSVGFSKFIPDACLINSYSPSTRLSLHQDRDEQDLSAPIVSVSLGIRAVFLFGGLKRKDSLQKFPIYHGDIVVWGGVDRLRYHGVLSIAESDHPLLGKQRINLTFRKAG
ncbi:DNA oxidative demethylase AlkB [Candidatus Nitrosacidococcus tergens]|uniref:Oxidative demethylase of N1-methyladenine or N3-methylcytosine DNA lesions n=1 Tax=Candidatus Nitrosacidococcus tergens TaxID=553981 RepID=A0A7G1Q8X8_9GAMM|nr:DNA oxidative demethylase AlkB [Candidatus Nitrosacidococcus tergens]CAB1275479.1 oxidative demethylase of N1-methyladenine or N3-methylcytosine DNA lesions [Candidatus Nitrosacidococcus tergens]